MRTRPRTRTLLALATFAVAAALAPRPAAATLRFDPPREVDFRLGKPGAASSIDLLLPLRDVASDRIGPYRLYAESPYGRWIREPRFRLTWSPDGKELAFEPVESAAGQAFTFAGAIDLELEDAAERKWLVRYDRFAGPSFQTTGFGLTTDGFSHVFRLPPLKPVVDWRCRRRPVLVMRSGGENDRFDLVRCDGDLAPEALDRLSILARPPEASRPGDLLPDEPMGEAWAERHEWTPGVRLVHPRLVWALQKIADAFPHRAIVIYSGYRPLAEVNDGTGHKSLHAGGRALDIAVHKVDNEELFRVCTKLRGIGCGFYPNQKFLHLDVRRAGPGEAFFVDGSKSGEPAQYLTEYPGLVQAGKLVPAPPKN